MLNLDLLCANLRRVTLSLGEPDPIDSDITRVQRDNLYVSVCSRGDTLCVYDRPQEGQGLGLPIFGIGYGGEAAVYRLARFEAVIDEAKRLAEAAR